MTPVLGEWENELRTRDSHTKAVYIKRIPGKHVGLGNVLVMFLHIYATILKTSAKSTSDVRSIVFSQSVLSDSPASSEFNDKWNPGSNVWTCTVSSIRFYVQFPRQRTPKPTLRSLPVRRICSRRSSQFGFPLITVRQKLFLVV